MLSTLQAPTTTARGMNPARLMSAPLPDLLATADAVLVESSIPDRGFLGAAHPRGDGWVLSMPKGRPDVERELVARYLLGRALGVDVVPLPGPLHEARCDGAVAGE